MKCPKCGHWNKPSFPRCFTCGEPLNANDKQAPSWQQTFTAPPPQKMHIVYDDAVPPTEDIQPLADEKLPSDEPLAAEMVKLKDRRERGAVYLSEFRKNASEKGIAPSGAGVTIQRSTGFFQEIPDDPEETLYEPRKQRASQRAQSVPRPVPRVKSVSGKRARSDAYASIANTSSAYDLDMDIPPTYDETLPLAPSSKKRKRHKRHTQNSPVWVAIWAVRVLIAGVLLFGLWQGYMFLLSSTGQRKAADYAAADVTIVPHTVDGYPGRRVCIAGEEGAQFYISELQRSYVVVGGVATIDVADHVFYDMLENIDVPQMDVSLTPTFMMGAREERLASIEYTIDIPMSPVDLIAPETNYLQVTTSIYNMQMKVLPGSRVTINGENISDSVNENGIVTYNPPVHAIGDNIIRISVKAAYHRENNLVVTLYRPPQDVPLELLADTTLKTSKAEVTIYAATTPGATVTIETPHKDFKVDQIAENGNFSFVALMSKVGYNRVQIRASLPGKEDSVLEHNIYYLPTPEVYTPKAWTLNANDYSDLLINIALRVNNAQIYLCQGVIKEILSEKPQLAIMDTGTGGKEQLVLLQNESLTVWQLGQTYRVYADVTGLYGNMPRFIGRYTYNPL